MQKEPAILAGLEDKYVHLAQIIVTDLFFAKSLSFIVDQAEYDSLAVALVNISMEGGNTLSIIRQIVASEFERNFREPGSILRGNCVASKMMGAFSRKVGANYLRQCIGSLVQKISKDQNLSLEIDPVKIPENTAETVKKQSKELLKRTTEILERAIAGFTAEYAKIYCPDRLHPLIGGFIMLRLFNPSLVTPEAFGILEDSTPLSRQARRNLTLITKLLQNLSNGVPFGSKETYMIPMNSFITDNQGKMNDFLSRIAVAAQNVASEVDMSQESKKLSFSGLKAKDLELIHQLLYNYKDKVLALLAVEVSKYREKEFQAEETLFQILDELGPPKRKARPRREETKGLTFLTPPEKSGYIVKKTHSRSISLLGDNKRLWIVLTEGFLHFFNSPQNTKPLRSISLDEIWTSVSGEKDNTLGYSFTLNYYRKEHLMYLQQEEDVVGWSDEIKNIKEKFGRMGKRQVDERLRPIEVRIRNHSMGLKLSYNVTVPEFDWDKDSRIYFVLLVQAFSNSYKVRKTLSDFKELNQALVKTFPRIIFPTFPKKIGEETSSGMPLGRYNGRASFAVSVMLKFLRSYFHEIKSNLVVQQSEVILDFLGLMCPIKAVEHNHIAQLSRLLQMSVDFNKHDPDGYTALHRAIELDRIEAVKWLSDCSTVHINSKDNNGNSPLILAIELNKFELVKILIDAGAETKLKNNVRSSPLHIAAGMGLKNICELLLDKGVKIDELNMKRKSPLHYAINRRYPDVVALLLAKGANTGYTDTFGNTLISLATAAKLPETVKYLLESTDISVNSQGQFQATALHFAAANGCVESTKHLLKHKADPLIKDIQQSNCLYTSVSASTNEVFDVLIEHCKQNGTLILDQELFGSNLIHKAAISPKSAPLIRTLVKHGANINIKDHRGRTALFLACANNNVDAVSLLLESGANPSIEDAQKRTPLYMVAFRGYTESCEMLLKDNADPNTIDVDGTTPLHASIWNCRTKAAKLLLEHKADINRTEFFQGNSPLHLAIQMKHFELSDMLIKKGANLNSQRICDGNTPLHYSIDCDFLVLARLLSRIPDTDFTIKNKSGETAIAMAINRNSNPEFIRTLKAAKDKISQ